MSITGAIRDMLAKGLSIEQALEAAELLESREEARRAKKKAAAKADAEKENIRKRELNAARQQRYRDAHPDRIALRNAARRHVTSYNASNALPPQQKETFPPTPPLLEKLNPPLIVADATIVNGSVDVCDFNDLANVKKGNVEALQAFGEQWNALAATYKFPSIDEIKSGSTRERHALARLREMGPGGVDTLMTRIRGSPYLRGEVNGFRVTFDWIVNPSNYQKIMEGNYENRKIQSFRK